MRRKTSRFLAGLIFILTSVSCFSQVVNNKISERLELIPDGPPVQSTTAASTVEWECISKKLTGKCIVYHNDQWFSFSVPDPGSYFINVSNQKCKDLYGIQMIIIEGNPCDTENYILKRCISKLSMDDLFVELGTLKANQQYLLNIDGFLGDYCTFEIQLSKKPQGLPETIEVIDHRSEVLPAAENLVRLQWHAHDSLLSVTRNFSIFRKEIKEKKYTFLTESAIQSNAAGAFVNDYLYTDTLTVYGTYDYLVIANKDTASVGVLKKYVSWHEERKKLMVNHTINLHLTFSKPGEVDILVIEPTSNWVVRQYSTEFTFQKPQVELSLNPFFARGMRDVIIRVKNSKTREVNNFRYVLDDEGWKPRQIN